MSKSVKDTPVDQAYIRLASGKEMIVAIPVKNAMAVADAPYGHSYGNDRIVLYIHESQRGFKRMAKRFAK